MNALTIFHDPGCGLCGRFRRWLEGQALWVPVEFVGFDSAEARRRFPGIGSVGAEREIVVMADDGSWWQGPDAWLVCLWATRAHRVLSHRLAGPVFRPWLRRIVHAISQNRVRISWLLGLPSERELETALAGVDCVDGNCRLPALKEAKTEMMS
jgi:predicted DCC family thiol-disulfide oxidoreductase YuxK